MDLRRLVVEVDDPEAHSVRVPLEPERVLTNPRTTAVYTELDVMMMLLLSLVSIALCGAQRLEEEHHKEPLEETYYGVKGQPKPWKVPKFSNIDSAVFREYLSLGKPLIVTDATVNLPLQNWTCRDFKSKFAKGSMRMEYNAKGNPSDANTQRFGDEKWMDKSEPSGAADKEAPQLAPFYWGIKESAWEKHRGDEDLLQMVRNLTKVPYFMAEANLFEMQQTPEFWFSKPGAGAKAHMDSHCQSTMALTLSGTKRWRLGEIPRETPRLLCNYLINRVCFRGVVRCDLLCNYLIGEIPRETPRTHGELYVDGAVYKPDVLAKLGVKKWLPTYEVELHAGEALFFPPGFIHETVNVGEDCAASVTYQFPDPAPALYWRNFLARVRRTGDLSGCHRRIEALATLQSRLPKPGQNAYSKGLERGRAIDGNRNGILDEDELFSVMKQDSGAALSYHDTDQNGELSVEEFAGVYNDYVIIKSRVNEEKAVDPENDRKEDEGDGDDDGEEEEEQEDFQPFRDLRRGEDL